MLHAGLSIAGLSIAGLSIAGLSIAVDNCISIGCISGYLHTFDFCDKQSSRWLLLTKIQVNT